MTIFYVRLNKTTFNTAEMLFKKAMSILPPKCRRQQLGWSYCAASPKLDRNKVKTKDKPKANLNANHKL